MHRDSLSHGLRLHRAGFIALLALLGACAAPSPSLPPAAAPMAATAAAPPSWPAVRSLNWPQQGQSVHRGYEAPAKAAFWRVQAAGGIELYCQVSFDASDASAKQIGGRSMNIEHVAPADRIAEALGYSDRDCNTRVDAQADPDNACKYAIADLHNMWPAYGSLNSSRGKLRYADIAGEDANRRFTEFCADYERAPQGSETFVEPALKARGNVARSLIYMSMVYDLPLDLAIDDPDRLLTWNRDDPPDSDERQRELQIRQVQGTWNPLVLPH